MINKYKVKIEILVNASDEEEAEYETAYQLYNDSYDKDTTKINIELLEEEDDDSSEVVSDLSDILHKNLYL